MRSTFAKAGILAVALIAAATFAVGVNTRSAGAQSPFVSAGGPYSGVAGSPVTFQAAVSPSVGPLIAAHWSFGDGTTGAGLTVAKTYAAGGVYGVTVTVTNYAGQSFSATTTASIAGGGSLQYIVITPYGAVVRTASPQQLVVPANTQAALSVRPLVTTTCGYGAVVINGYYYCGGYTTLLSQLQVTYPACYALWVQTGVMPACAYLYR